jgi:hypothetical protein
MNQNRTASILQRFAVVLAVTAASYGLPQTQAQAQARTTSHGNSQHSSPAQPQQQR